MAKATRAPSVNKKNLTDKLAFRANISKTRAAEYIDIVTKIIAEALMDGKKVTISDFGTFNLSQREAFEGYDPKNKVRIQVPRRIIPVFRAGKQLKTSLNIPSIRRCTIKGPKQLEVEFSKLMDTENSEILESKSYSIVYTNGANCPITKVSICRENSVLRATKENVIGVESVLIDLQENIVGVDYIVELHSELQDIDGNAAKLPVQWSNNTGY